MNLTKIALQPPERDRLQFLEHIVQTSVQAILAGATDADNALREIRDRELFRETDDTWADYCQRRWSWTSQHVNGLLNACATMRNLPPALAKQVKSPSAAKALSRVPPPKRKAVVKAAAAATGKATAAGIKKASAIPPPPKKAAAKRTVDGTGKTLPIELERLWAQGKAVQGMLTALIDIKSTLKAVEAVGDPLYVEVPINGVIAAIDQLFADIKRAKPYAVCHACQGRAPDQCTACKGRGFVSQFFWENCVPIEFREMREKEKVA